VQQITVSRVNFHHLETRGERTFGSGDEVSDHLLDLRFVQLPRLGVLRVKGNRRWTYRYPTTVLRLDAAMLADPRPMGAGLAPSVGQLDASHRALGGDKTGDALQRFDLLVVPQAQVLCRDAAIGSHGGGLGENQPGAADGTTAEVHQMPVIGQSIVTGVLAHRRDGNAVQEGQLAQGIGFEQLTHGAPLLGSMGTVQQCLEPSRQRSIAQGSDGKREPIAGSRAADTYISTWVPSSITRFTGSLKKRRLPLAFFNMNANKASRQRAMPSIFEAITVSRLRK